MHASVFICRGFKYSVTAGSKVLHGTYLIELQAGVLHINFWKDDGFIVEKAVLQQLKGANLTSERGVKKYGSGFYKFRESKQPSFYTLILCFPYNYAERITAGNNFFSYDALFFVSSGQKLRPYQELKRYQD